MKYLITVLILIFSADTWANGKPLSQMCKEVDGKYLKNKIVLNMNVTRLGWINYKLSGEGDVWYLLHAQDSPVYGVMTQYDFVKIAFLTRAPINVCLYQDTNTLGFERTKDINN